MVSFDPLTSPRELVISHCISAISPRPSRKSGSRRRPMTLRRKLLLLCLITLSLASIALAEDHEADHNELRALLRTATDAMNTGNFDALRPLFYDKFSITTVDQELFTNLDNFKAYYEGLLKGGNAQLK